MRRAGSTSTTDRHTGGRSTLGTLALALTILSIIGLVLMVIGSIAEWKGFSEDPDDNSTFADSCGLPSRSPACSR